nr:MAG TPA: hypothetical protein [Bacteriophage sp.]
MLPVLSSRAISPCESNIYADSRHLPDYSNF